MNGVFLRDLAVMTVRDPGAAARTILGLGLPVSALWTALALMAVLNALLFGVMVIMAPAPSAAILSVVSPYWFLVIVGAMLVGLVWAVTKIGRWMGGAGQMADVLALTVWMMSLRIAVLTASMLLTLVFPALAVILLFAAFVVGFWIAVNFVDVVHGFGSPGRAVAVLLAAMFATFVLVTLVLSVVAAPFMGTTYNV